MAILGGCLIAHAEITDGGGHVMLAQVGTEDPLVDGLVAWAGSVAEGVPWIGEDDHAAFAKHGFHKVSIATMRQWCERLIQLYRPAVKAVAKALEARGKLSGLTVKRIAFKACPRLRKDAAPLPRGCMRQFLAGIDDMPEPPKGTTNARRA